MKTHLRYSFYPLLILGGLALVSALLKAGIHPAVAAMGSTVVGIVFIMLTERILPFEPTWNQLDAEWKTDLKHLLLTQALLPKLLTIAWTFVFVWVGTAVSDLSLFSQIWPHSWNPFAQMLLATLLISFGRYWAHRLSHEINILWKFHAIHHSGRRLYWLNAGRWNPLDKAFVSAPEIIPFLLFGIQPDVLALYSVFMSLNSLMQHANIDIRLGWLNYLINANESHRWHHSVVIAESNNNYGNPLAIWDLLFGTFLLPQDRRMPERLGLQTHHVSRGYLDDVLHPFRQLFKRNVAPIELKAPARE